ncbi:mucin-associated surface protein (MASP), putative, partial [Trypanosoma cruzi marinkellei]
EVTTSERNKTVPSPGTVATPQSHHDNGTEETGEDTKATKVIVNTNDTRNTQNSVSNPEAAKAVEPGAGMESNPTNNNSSPPSTGAATRLSTIPNAKGPSDIKENQNSRSAENATATVATAAQTNDTSKSGDSDGSTAVSHSTSPLLLLFLLLRVRLQLRWWLRESEGERAVHRPRTHSFFTLCVCVPFARTLVLTSAHDAHT